MEIKLKKIAPDTRDLTDAEIEMLDKAAEEFQQIVYWMMTPRLYINPLRLEKPVYEWGPSWRRYGPEFGIIKKHL